MNSSAQNYMGRVVRAAKSVAAVAALMLSCAASGVAYYDGTYWWNYEIVDGGVRLYQSDHVAACDPEPVGDFAIPSTLDGKKVVQLGRAAFYNCPDLESAVIPQGVTSIGSAAFAFCYYLESVTIPNSVTSIGEYAFFATSLGVVRVADGDTARVRQMIADSGYEDMASLVFVEGSPKSCTITFNANGGTVSEATRTVMSGDQIGPTPVPLWDNYRFEGWFTAASGGTAVYSSYRVGANVTYYAHWSGSSWFTHIAEVWLGEF